MIISLFIILAYLLGSIPFGLLVAWKVRGIDIRSEGSKNIGATNVFRVIGKKWGILVFFLDALKGFAAVIFPYILPYDMGAPWNILLGVAAILGHSFPVWLGFKGGKGVATSFGVFLALAFLPCILSFLLFSVVFALCRILSIASLSAALCFPVLVILLMRQTPGFQWYVSVSLALAVFIFYTHRQNIKRILKGEEKRLI